MIYGYTFSKEDRSITGEQDVLRYSALDCWLKNKDAYRRRYYEGETFHSPEMFFGSEIHKMLESKKLAKKHPILSQLPRYEKAEHNIQQEFGGIKIAGCLDSFEPETFSLLDYKSSHLTKEGKVPWDKVRVAKHMQLVFYSLLVKLKYGKVNPWVLLIWIETHFKDKNIAFGEHILTASTRELELTGRFEVFKRRIAQWELAHLKKLITKSAQEISEDFINYKSLHE